MLSLNILKVDDIVTVIDKVDNIVSIDKHNNEISFSSSGEQVIISFTVLKKIKKAFEYEKKITEYLNKMDNNI